MLLLVFPKRLVPVLPNVLVLLVEPNVFVLPNVPPVLVLAVLPNKLVVPVFVFPNSPPG